MTPNDQPDSMAKDDPFCICCCRRLSEHNEKRQCPETSYFVENDLGDASIAGEGLSYATDDWKLKGYPSAAAEIEDMANVGRALMAAIEKDYADHPFMKGWRPADCPTEIVGDLLNALDEAKPTPVEAGALPLEEAIRCVIWEAWRLLRAG